jgi:hypothetical protein
MPEATVKITKKSWKIKAVERTKIITAQNKRIKEITENRDAWKEQCKLAREAELELRNLCQGKTSKYHHYCNSFIALCVEMHSYGGMSLRCCRHCLSSLVLIFGFSFRIPSHVSIRNWACKAGYSRIYESVLAGADKEQEYVIWLDESILIGSEKILLVLGMPLQQIAFTRAVHLQDVRVLSVEVGQRWLGEDIAIILADLSTKIKISYMVTDGGNNLGKAAKLGAYTQIQDCTHWIARILEKLYIKDISFKALVHLMGELRQKWYLSDKASYLPPKQRIKLRFANMFSLVDWAEKMLLQWHLLPLDVQSACNWLLKNKTFIEELIVLKNYCTTILGLLKTKGFNNNIHQHILATLSANTNVKTEKEAYFCEAITLYLEKLATQLATISVETTTILCCSDIIESAFGKFKQKIAKRNTLNMTEFMFTIANFGNHFTALELENALEKVSLQTLKDWKICNKNKRNTQQKVPKKTSKSGGSCP